MIIAAIDYTCCTAPWGPQVPGGPGGLDTKFAFDEMNRLKQICGIRGGSASLWNQQVTKANLQNNISQIGAQCQPGDTFIFFYSGHGDHLPDQDGDRLYNMAVWQYQKHHSSTHVQDISFNAVGDMFPWPLVPLAPYKSPAGCIPGEPPQQAANHTAVEQVNQQLNNGGIVDAAETKKAAS